MSGNGDPLKTTDASDGERKKKKQKALRFPVRRANGAADVYRKDLCYRDNSSYLQTLFNNQEDNGVCFTRPMQLGKSILFSLANELFSVNEKSNVDSDLGYSPSEDDRNKWFVLRINFGSVTLACTDTGLEQQCKDLDAQTAQVIKQSVVFFTIMNKELEDHFEKCLAGTGIKDAGVGAVILALANSVKLACGRLLILVDEYDQPIREGLLRLVPNHGASLYGHVKSKISTSLYPSYFGFFKTVKAAIDNGLFGKIWLTGILPIGIKEMSGLGVTQLTFRPEMANAVGLTSCDVERMLDLFHEAKPFQAGQRERTELWLQRHFNNLCFPGGEPLYHTGLLNGVMIRLQMYPEERRQFIENGEVPVALTVEPVCSSIFDVLCSARNLRHVVYKLVTGDPLEGYKLNFTLSLENLLQETIDIGDYLTLLVHVGVASVTTDATNSQTATFRLTSEIYRNNLLEPILRTLKASLQKLVSYASTTDLYTHGEDILIDFVTSISKNAMARLMAWASSDSGNHILELQFQAHVVTEAHDILDGVAQTTQEDRLPSTGKRTDVTFSSATSVVVLELKQVASGDPPEAAFIAMAHEQLVGYVETRRKMETAGRNRPVAGFVVIMYNDGASYVVEKLRGDNQA